MAINLKATNYELSEAIKSSVEEKVGGLTKYYAKINQIDVEIGKLKPNQNKGQIYFCEINVSVPNKLLRYRREGEDLTKALNDCRKGIQSEIVKYKEKNA